MSSFRNICCCAAATSGLLGHVDHGSGATLPASNHEIRTVSSDLPDVGDVVAAYTQGRRWLDAFRLPPIEAPEARIPIRDAQGICVLLRHSGRVVGIGHDRTGDDLMLRRAMGRAMSKALSDPAISRLPETLRDAVGRRLTFELDTAGRFIPVPGRTLDQLAHRFDPARDGVALRRRQRWSLSFPAQMQATNTSADIRGLLSGLASELGLSLQDLQDVQAMGELTCYRFSSIHLAQNGPNGIPFQAFRGGPLPSGEPFTATTLHAMAQSLIDHIASTRWPDEIPEELVGDQAPPSGLKGDYHPVSDAYEPIVAGPLDQALTAFALLRYATVAEGSPHVQEKATYLARSILNDLLENVMPLHHPTADPLLCAALVYALCEMDADDREPERMDLFMTALTAGMTRDGAFDPSLMGSRIEKLDPHGQAMVAGALSRAMRTGIPNHPHPEALRAMVDAIWESLPEHRHVSLLPWIGWAEADLFQGNDQPQEATDRLLALRRILQASRIGEASSESAPDLVGGFSLAGRRPGSPARATAQSLRPAVWMAGLLHPDRFANEVEFESALQAHLQTLEFMTRLMVRPGSEWRYRSPERAMGGLRAALWDQRQPVAAQAMGLLTIAETLGSPHFSPAEP